MVAVESSAEEYQSAAEAVLAERRMLDWRQEPAEWLAVAVVVTAAFVDSADFVLAEPVWLAELESAAVQGVLAAKIDLTNFG